MRRRNIILGGLTAIGAAACGRTPGEGGDTDAVGGSSDGGSTQGGSLSGGSFDETGEGDGPEGPHRIVCSLWDSESVGPLEHGAMWGTVEALGAVDAWASASGVC